MNLFSAMKVSPEQLSLLARGNTNRLRNGSFEDSTSSFYPWFPSGTIRLVTEAEAAFEGKNYIRFIPQAGQVGRISQKARTLEAGRLYMLRFAIRSKAKPAKQLTVQLGSRMILIYGDSIPKEFQQYAFIFRARSRKPRIKVSVFGSSEEAISVELDAISLRAI